MEKEEIIMPKLSKSQKKYIDQAIRRIERRFAEASKYEKEYAEKNRVKPPELKMPSKKEIYERIDTSKSNWAEQIKNMSSIDVYQPKAWGKLSKYGTTAGVKSFGVEEAIKVMKASKTGYEKTKSEEKKYTPLRNVLKIDADTIKKLSRSEEEEKSARRKIYLTRLRDKAYREVSNVSPELAKELRKELNKLIRADGEGQLSSLARAKTEVLAKSADDTTKEKLENTIKALENLDLGDFTSGLARIVGYETFSENLLPLMVALDMDVNKTYDKKSLMTIIDELGAVENLT